MILSISLIASIIAKLQYLFYNEIDIWTGEQTHWIQKLVFGNIGNFAKYWHNYEIHDVDLIKERLSKGSVLLIGYHSRCTVDNIYLLSLLRPNVLASYLFYKVPIINKVMPILGVIPSKSHGKLSTEDHFIETLTSSKKPMMLLPGGAYECMRPFDRKYNVDWKRIPGFARVLHDRKEELFQPVTIIPYFTKNCEEIYANTVSIHDFLGNSSSFLYEKMKAGNLLVMPLMLSTMILCMGFIFYPKPLKLDTYFGEPLEQNNHENSEEFANRVAVKLQELVDDVNSGKRDTPQSLKQPYEGKSLILYNLYGIYTFSQNLLSFSILLTLFWAAFPPIIFYTFYKNVKNLIFTPSKKIKPI